ncbi:MAG: TerC family protein [Betaproteobacteria bacterium]|nr:TerC family protein [Betaproteobacteria bacterium]
MTLTITDPAFWVALLQIIGIDIVLAGDNAVVIALAARSLPAEQQRKAIIYGAAAAIVIRVILTSFAAALLTVPWVNIVGAALLLWIGVKLLNHGDEDEGENIKPADNLMGAIKTIVVADVVMSLDNVIGVAGAAKGSLVLLVLGLLISIPLVIFSSQIILKVMARWPIIIVIGAALLGWVAGDMAVRDFAIRDWVAANAAWLKYAAPATGAVFVVTLGRWLAARGAEREAKIA